MICSRGIVAGRLSGKIVLTKLESLNFENTRVFIGQPEECLTDDADERGHKELLDRHIGANEWQATRCVERIVYEQCQSMWVRYH